MGDVVLPDSSFYIACTRAGLDPFRELANYVETYEFVTCGMVMLEVCRGLREPRVLRRFQERFAIMPFLPAHNDVWRLANDIAWGLDRRGIVLPATDILIAACALRVKATVLSREAHFESIPGLQVLPSL